MSDQKKWFHEIVDEIGDVIPDDNLDVARDVYVDRLVREIEESQKKIDDMTSHDLDGQKNGSPSPFA